MSSGDASAEYLANLCLIKLTEKEKEALNQNLRKILDYMELLNEIDTSDVLPCSTVLESMTNVIRPDVEGPPFDRAEFFRNAPDHVGGMIKVPPVIQFEE